MKLYSGLVERCFNSCVNDFTSKVLTGKEVRPDPPLGFRRPSSPLSTLSVWHLARTELMLPLGQPCALRSCLVAGDLRRQLLRQVPQALGARRRPLCRAQRRYAPGCCQLRPLRVSAGPECLLTDRPCLLGLSCDPSCSPDAASSVGRTAHTKTETLLCCLYSYVVLLALPAPCFLLSLRSRAIESLAD
jgi:hypothetical protein